MTLFSNQDDRSGGLAVVHLVRARNSVESLKNFLASYVARPAGIGHDLVIVFKGFPSEKVPLQYRETLGGLPHRRLFVSDKGYDITAYFQAARELPHAYLCFLNSFSLILWADWLALLHAHATTGAHGMVGASGSWQSLYSEIASGQYANYQHAGYKKWLHRRFPFIRESLNRVRRPVFQALFDSFPNYHLRTNAFLMRRETLLRIQVPRIACKLSAYAFESGKQGLSRQVIAMNQAPVVVGRDGKAYCKEEWHLSNTFWQADQENLLVGDNQTQRYQHGSAEARREYARLAWGAEARPLPPRASARFGGA